ncbi:MAG: hypothetical protein IJG16_03285 [Clostridia bacterium]|nr:hypothetical protein [Clostridia bacterium]
MKKKILALGCVAVLAVSMVTGCGTKAPEKKEEPKATAQAAVEKVTPTLMYFISNSDESLDAEKNTVEELKKEYGEKVNFTVINIDEDTEAAKNFPVQGNTPMVIMLNTKNDISAMSPKVSDKNQLKTIIDKAMTE